MGVSFQWTSGLFRLGPDHTSYEAQDPWEFCCVATPEKDGVIHLYGAISWHDAGDPLLLPVLRLAREMGFERARWERVDPETWERKDIEVQL